MQSPNAARKGSLDASAEMVSWFLNEAKAPLRMDERKIGEHKYFICSSSFDDESGLVVVCGRGLTKLEAATRCIGEWLERKAVFEFFRSSSETVPAKNIQVHENGDLISIGEVETTLLPMEFWTTNGWAIHTDLNKAQESAVAEALERSLLMSSFLRWGWQGLVEINRMSVDQIEFHSCISRYKTEQFSAGFAISRNMGAPGISFGHFSEKTDRILQTPKWTHALYEAADKFEARLDRNQIKDPIAVDVKWYMVHGDRLDLADDKTAQEKIKFSNFSLHVEDIAVKWNLPFPLYSAFAFGGDLMPLFLPRELSDSGRELVLSIGKSLGFKAVIPERTPIL